MHFSPSPRKDLQTPIDLGHQPGLGIAGRVVDVLPKHTLHIVIYGITDKLESQKLKVKS